MLIGCASLSVQLAGSGELFSQLSDPLVLEARNLELYKGSFDVLLRELAEPKLGSNLFAECLMKQIVILMLRKHLYEYGPHSLLLAPVADAKLLRVVADVVAHPERRYSLDSLAALAGMSRSGFAARFAERYKQTPMGFVQYIRMHSAARLLRTSEMSVECLAKAVGYLSRSQFSRAFKSVHGVDPTKFRKRERSEW
jgi:transcriptional regulator GlxA family with amidase domain